MKSWVESSNTANTDFPIENLPFGVFYERDRDRNRRVGIAIGDQIIDVAALLETGLLKGLAAEAAENCRAPVLNHLMSLGHRYYSALRAGISQLMSTDCTAKAEVATCLVPMQDAELVVPVEIGDYTDFYASIHHATNVGRLFRPDSPLLPNYKYVPIAYHGRASSIVIGGTLVSRPCGQIRQSSDEAPTYAPSQRLDYELEVGVLIGRGNSLGTRIPIDEAADHWFGLCLVNDWSARDIQAWEYQPLGPFLAKSFATTISPWIVTAEALVPFHTRAFKRPEGDPEPLPYLNAASDQESGGIDLTLEVYLQSDKMRKNSVAPVRLSRGNFRDMYWSIAQMITHHASNGCNLRVGDLIASGTVSGATEEARGCLLELTRGGAEPISLPSGETRTFLADGDEVILRGRCEREGVAAIGFGECRGRVNSA